jgi:hypothetical protein
VRAGIPAADAPRIREKVFPSGDELDHGSEFVKDFGACDAAAIHFH